MENTADFKFFDLAREYNIIDMHIHPYTSDEQNICNYQGLLKLTKDDIKKDMYRAGISRYAGSVLDASKRGKAYSEDFSIIKKCNDTVLEMAKEDPNLIPGIHIHPAFPEESINEMKRCHAMGVRLIGELVPYLMDWVDYADPVFSDLLDVAGKLGMVVNFHSNDEGNMETMIRSHPDVIFIAAHPGARHSFLAHVERIKKYENAYLDLSGTGIFRYGMIEYGVKKVGSERLLFGSDYPTCMPGMYVGGVLYERITERDRENIFHNNAARLLGIK